MRPARGGGGEGSIPDRRPSSVIFGKTTFGLEGDRPICGLTELWLVSTTTRDGSGTHRRHLAACFAVAKEVIDSHCRCEEPRINPPSISCGRFSFVSCEIPGAWEKAGGASRCHSAPLGWLPALPPLSVVACAERLADLGLYKRREP
ncbi:unnamed protein product [Lampetra planeri]